VEVAVERRSSGIHLFLFFVLFTSFDDSEEAYINRVIIPEEKVKMRTNGNHLLFDEWYRGFVDRME